jgi:hypothetical protein
MRFKKVVLVISLLFSFSCLSFAQFDGGGPGGGPGEGGPGGMPPGEQSNQQAEVEATAVKVISGSKELKSKTFTATKSNQSVIIIKDKGTLTGENLTIIKGDGKSTSEEKSNFLGINAGVLAESASSSILNGCSVYTAAEGSNAVFAHGKDAKITINNMVIETKKNSSRGLDATYGGVIIADGISITTNGAHCAALATDRGEGTVSVNHCRAQTAGDGSPGIYSTGNISASNSSFMATGSEACVIEGKNSITLDSCTLVGNRRCGVMLYQSYSGDAGVGTSVLTMNNSKMTAATGPMFYCTNTHTSINLTNDDLVFDSGVILKADGAGRWGNKGKNGAQVDMTTNHQILKGDIKVDSLSSANITFAEGTDFSGAINADDQSQKVILTLCKGTKVTLTADSYLSSVIYKDMTEQEAVACVNLNGHRLIIAGK